jgi:hypothetical protein
MTRSTFASVLVLCLAAAPAGSQAATCQCQLPSGKLEYRDTPCPQGAQRVIETAPAAPPATPRAHGEEEHANSGAPIPRTPDLYTFAHMTISVRQALEMLAPGPSGHLRVVVDPAITVIGFFDYDKVTLPELLADVARRYNLDIRLENDVITARPR